MNKTSNWKSGVNPRSVVVLLFAVILIFNASVLCSLGDDQPTAIPSVVVKYRDQCYIPDYAAQLEVYEVANSAASGQRRTFCFVPHPILDSTRLKQAFESLQSSLSDAQKVSTATFALPVKWTYDLERVKSLVANFLKNKYGGDIQPSDIQTVPLNAYVVYVPRSDGTQVSLKHLPDIQPGVLNAQQVLGALPEPASGKLVASFIDISNFVENPAIGAHGYVTAAQLTTTAVSISGSIFTSADFRDQVNGKGGLQQTLTSQSSSGGVGIALPVVGGLFGGQQNSSGASESSSINRFVSRNFVQSAFESGSSKIYIREFTDSHSGQGLPDVIKQLLSFALENMNHTTAMFEKQKDGLYKLHSDSLNTDLGTGMTLSQIAAATKGDSEFSGKLQHDVQADGVKASDASELTDSGKSDISWTASGNILVPSTVDLYYASNDQFSHNVTTEYLSDEASYANYIYDSPATVLSSDDGAPIDAEIGAIIASMVPWEAASAAFRAHYLPADGREVDKSSQYYALINRQRPSGQSDLSQVNVPDLRGMFLRGLNVMDPQSSVQLDPGRADENNRVVGGYEADEVGPHQHNLSKLGNYPNGNGGDGSHIGEGGTLRKDYPIDSNATKETRPKNIAVYYYIRVN
jgi:hypothetical protein